MVENINLVNINLIKNVLIFLFTQKINHLLKKLTINITSVRMTSYNPCLPNFIGERFDYQYESNGIKVEPFDSLIF